MLVAPPATVAQEAMVSTLTLSSPLSLDGIVVAPDGSLYGADGFNGFNVYHIQPDGSSSVVASGLAGPIDMDFDANGALYLTTFNNQGFFRLALDGSNAQRWATVAPGPSGVVVNRAMGKGYVSHYGTGALGNGTTIYEIDLATQDASVWVQQQGLNAPVSLAIDEAGNVYTANIADARVFKITPAGEISLLATLPVRNNTYNIGHLAFANGALYVTGNRAQPVLYRVSMDGSYEIIAGTGQIGSQDGPGSQARFRGPNGIAASVTGDTLYISELDNPSVLRVVTFPGAPTDTGEATDLPQDDDVRLGPSFPNPVFASADPHATLTYALAAPAHLSIHLHDALGRTRNTVFEGFQQAGTHQVEVDFSAYAPGVYFYALHNGQQVHTQSVMLIR